MRLDNDPTLRMLPWSTMNFSALGGNETTGSFANVAYERNKTYLMNSLINSKMIQVMDYLVYMIMR
jgi:hypothetical protein